MVAGAQPEVWSRRRSEVGSSCNQPEQGVLAQPLGLPSPSPASPGRYRVVADIFVGIAPAAVAVAAVAAAGTAVVVAVAIALCWIQRRCWQKGEPLRLTGCVY